MWDQGRPTGRATTTRPAHQGAPKPSQWPTHGPLEGPLGHPRRVRPWEALQGHGGQGRGAEHFFGAWGWFALLVSVAILAPVVEELLFRGLLPPRMRAAVGRWDWAVNGALFGVYHLHQPWSIPSSVLDGMFGQAYPTKRFQSIWIAIITHTAPSFVIIGVVLSLVF